MKFADSLYAPMKLAAAILFALTAFLAPLQSQEPAKSHPRLLLAPGFSWQKQSGEWSTTESSVVASAKETLSEYAASSGIPLKGRWLSVRIAMEGETTKAGFWLAGLRDEKGDLVRLQLDATSGSITNGRGRTIATLPAGTLEKPVELLLKFTNATMTLHSGGSQIAELPVVFEEANATPSLFVERGRATFSDLMLGGVTAKPELTKTGPPKRIVVAPKAVASAGFAVDFTDAKMTALKGEWQQYFGVHNETAPGPWKTVRQFDGPGSGLPLKSPLASKRMDGPFNQTPVEMDLSWFRDQQKRNSLGLDRNIPVIVQNDITAIFIAPWKSMLGKIQQDQIWALLKLAYGSDTGAEKRLIFQWGDDINSQALGTSADVRSLQIIPRHGTAYPRNANQPASAVAYAENYFAPAVEALRRASTDVFGDERRIPVMIGSCSRAGLEANRDWFRMVLDHIITGELAPSLKDKRVIDLVDYLTVNFPFADAADTKALQALWTTYGKQVKGLWITGEFGNLGRGPGHVLQRAALFFEWVAANNLDPNQARLLWDFAARKRASDESVSLAMRLAETMRGPLQFGMDAQPAGTLYRISASGNRLLVIFIPSTDRRGLKLTPIGEISVEVGEDRAKNPWIARMVHNSLRRAPDEIIPLKVDGSRLLITPTTTTIATWAVMLEMP